MGIQKLLSFIIKNDDTVLAESESKLYLPTVKTESNPRTAHDIAARADSGKSRQVRIITTVEELNSPTLLHDGSIGVTCIVSPPHSIVERKEGINYWASLNGVKPLSSQELFERATINGIKPEFVIMDSDLNTHPHTSMNTLPAISENGGTPADKVSEPTVATQTHDELPIPESHITTLREDIDELAAELIEGITGEQGDKVIEAEDAMRDAIAYRLHRILANHEQEESK